jgi:pimeloyl-ACP methyl ester carboxylesterase
MTWNWLGRLTAVSLIGLSSGCCAGRCNLWSHDTRDDNTYFRVDGRADYEIAIRRVSGPGSNPTTLIFLHGLGQSKFSWRDVGRQMARQFPVVLIDLLGHGDSDKPRDAGVYRMSEQARYIHQWLQTESAEGRLGRVVIVGLSYGGGIALDVARLNHRAGGVQLSGVVAVAPAAFYWPYFESDEFAEETLFLKGAVTVPWLCALASSRIFQITVLERAFWRPHRISNEYRAEIHHQYRTVTQRRSAARATLDMADELRHRGTTPRFEEVRCPVLLLYGEFDDYVDRTVMDALERDQRGNANFEFEIIRDAGHDLPNEKPTRVIEALREFLKACSP